MYPGSDLALSDISLSYVPNNGSGTSRCDFSNLAFRAAGEPDRIHSLTRFTSLSWTSKHNVPLLLCVAFVVPCLTG